MSSTDIPEPWASRLVERGLTDRRGTLEIPSMSALAEATGVHTSTISGAIRGSRRPSPATVAALVRALGPDVQDWLGVRVELGPYEPPEESRLLTKPQREALTMLIRSIAAEQREEGGSREQRAAATSDAGGTPAPHLATTLGGDDVVRQPESQPVEGGSLLFVPDVDGNVARDEEAYREAYDHLVAALGPQHGAGERAILMLARLIADGRAKPLGPDAWRGPASRERRQSRRDWMREMGEKLEALEGRGKVQDDLDEQAKAARRGTPAHLPDTTTGEESQVPPEDEDPA